MAHRIALVGMPNVGKTALFNKLTGSFQRVANFPGVTVEKKTGWTEHGFEIIDLPGIYSLDATTLDEKVTKDFLLQKESHRSADLFVLVLDATNLEKSLFLALQLKSLGWPLLVALNLMDEGRKRGLELDLNQLASFLGAEIIPTSASTGEGVEELKSYFKHKADWHLPHLKVPGDLQRTLRSPKYVGEIFNEIDEALKTIVKCPIRPDTLSQKIDHYVLHPVSGPLILVGLLMFVFQLLFAWSAPLQDLIETGFNFLGVSASQIIDDPVIRSFVVDGMINGVGGVLVFLPQILLLFFFIQLLEDFGYLGRAAFLMDSLMRRMGLPGKAVIPLLSSHACAIPGVMATRVIDNYRERLITMMVIPLTTCSARLPVYAVLIAAMIPDVRMQGLALFGLYSLGFFSAMIMALVFKKSLPQSSPSMLLMELPPYRIPRLVNLLMNMKNKAKLFVVKAGTIILAISIVLWVLVTFPKDQGIENSYAAQIGHMIEPVFRPLGFDWRITTALIPSIAAREVSVSALSLVLSVEESASGFEKHLASALVREFGLDSLVALLIWFVFAPQCISTFAIIRRETNSLRWPVFMVSYTLALAYVGAFLARTLVNLWS